MVGRTVGKYRIVDQIGRGGMGTVYGAIDETLDRRVAIKVLNADLIDQDAVERFRREAMTLARLNHGRIGAIHELTRDGHDLLMVMEFLEGETFEKLIERGPLPIPRAVALIIQILDALQYAHGAGVIHRDLKPANVILSPSGEIKVMDFGIARVQGSEHLTTSGFMVGTPAYMAPEQVRGEEVDPRMDLYAVTVVLYRMLTQRLPFHGDTAIAMIHSQLTNMPTPPRQYRADLPEWLVSVLDRGLAKVPAERFQTAAEFRAALEGGLTGRRPVPTGVVSGEAVTTGPVQTPPSAQIPKPPATASAPVATSTASAPPMVVSASPTGSTGALPAEAAPPVAPAPTRAEATVTLRAPHLATAGILLALLVIGVGVLAFIALRRPTTAVAPPAEQQATANVPSSDTTTAATPAATPATNAAPAVAAPAMAVPAAGTAAVRPATTTPPGSTTPTATGTGRASATPATGAASPARGATGTATPVGGPSSGSAAPTAPVTAAPSTANVAGNAASTLPAAASAPAENFGDIKALVVDGGKSREVDALLSLEPGNLIVRSRVDGSVLRTLSYSSIGAATYARGRRPRGQAAPDVVAVPDNLGGSGLLGGARHWLTLQAPSEFLIVRLEDRNVIRVLNSVEARTGVKVQRNQSD